MFRYFPHRGENVRIVHNVQRDEIVGDMGKYVPRIYASLDNNKVEY
jgi:hypothetical protein